MTSEKKHILVLPRWYPNRSNDQLGIFIARQVDLMKADFYFSILYAQGIPNFASKFELVEENNTNLDSYIVYFNQSTGVFRKLINFIRYRKALKIGFKKIKKKVDLCHVHVPYRTAETAIRLKKQKGIPFLITEHWSGHLNGQYKAKNFLDKYLYRRVLKRSDKISTVSETLRTEFKKNTGFDSVHTPNYIEQYKAKSELNSGIIEILSVADFSDEIKNISGVLTAYRAVLNANNNLHLTIIGGGPDENKINQLISKLNFPNNTLSLVGRQNHDYVLKAMQTCNFYICNSRFETFGMTVAEALLAGKPVISTLCGGPTEFLTDSNSIQINPAPIGQLNSEELQVAIEKMITTYTQYDSDRISQEIEVKFGRETVRNTWLDFYKI